MVTTTHGEKGSGKILANTNGVPSIAGWYDDPEDPSRLRYSNGRSWVGEPASKTAHASFNNGNVYRPGGAVTVEEKQARQDAQPVAQPAPAPEPEGEEPTLGPEPDFNGYQPLSRRERRKLEQELAIKNAPEITATDEFEFASAPPQQKRSYAPPAPVTVVPEEDTAEVPADLVAAVEEAIATEAAPTFTGIDSFEEEPESEELPSIFSAPSKWDEDEDSGDDLPQLDFQKIELDAPQVDTPQAEQEVETTTALPVFNPLPFDSDSSEEPAEDEDDPYRMGFASKFNPEEANEPTVTVLDDDDVELVEPTLSEPVLDPEPFQEFEFKPLGSNDQDEAIAVEAKEESEPETAVFEFPSLSESEAASDLPAEEESKELPVEEETKEDDGDDDQGFGFQSKLNRFPNREKKEAPLPDFLVQEPKTEEPEVKAPEVKEPVLEEKPVVEEDIEDDAEEDEGDEKPKSAGGFGKLKGIFGKNRKSDDTFDPEAEEAKEDEAPETEASPVVAAPVTEKKSNLPEEDDDEDDEDDENEDEKPQLKAGLFSSRQEKENAAVEAELIGRLIELRDKVLDLQEQETATQERIDALNKEEAAAKARVIKAHEEHEILDGLVAARQREINDEKTNDAEQQFRDFIDSHPSETEGDTQFPSLEDSRNSS